MHVHPSLSRFYPTVTEGDLLDLLVHIKDIEITFFNKRIFDVSKLVEFVDRIEIQKSDRRADILSSERCISISLTQPGAPKCLKVQVLYETLSGQAYSMAQICSHFSTFISLVRDLRINVRRSPSGQDGVDGGLWLDLIDSFTGVKWFHLAGNLSTNILLALQPSERWRKTMLPVLHKLYIRESEPYDASLWKAVVSFMYSRRLSGGRFLEVEYERLWADELLGKGPFSQLAAIEILPDDILLKIFLHCLDASPQFWPTLTHVCQNWRRIVLTSPRRLHLRLYPKLGLPLSKTLDCWPTLPVVVQYGGSPTLDPPTPEDEDNITAALKQSDRVSFISLTITISLLERISTISEPFLELEELVLLSHEDVRLTLPSTFRWGPRLHTLHLTRIAFTALLQLLLSSRNLVDLQLREVLDPWLISPAMLVNALSGMPQLQSLLLHFTSTTDYIASPLLFGERTIFPVLTRLNYRGLNSYLEGLVAIIDAPGLKDIEITFFNKRIGVAGVSKLRGFIDRIEMQKSHRRAYILSSERCVSISLTQPGAPTCLKVQVLCENLCGQVYSMAQICSRFSGFILRVEDLHINVTRSSSGHNGADGGQWLDLIDSFTSVKWFHLAGNLSTNVMLALQSSERRHETVLPALHKLCLQESGPHNSPLREAAVSFMHSRRLSGCFIAVELYGTEPFSQQTAMAILSEDVLLKIFIHCLDTSPQFWPTLTQVCQSWRRTVFASPRSLRLRLFYKNGRPISKTPDFWPTLPVVVQYGGSPKLGLSLPEANVVAALKQSSRVCSIDLVVTTSLLESLSTISDPFLELEELVLLSQENVRLTLPSTFRWGPRLCTLHTTRIAFRSFPQLLLPSRDLVDLRLHEIPVVGYFSPEEFANALSGMTQLRSLSLHFLTRYFRNDFGFPSQSGQRIVLPALAFLKYQGSSKYLDSLVARIDAPYLGDVDITVFGHVTVDTPQLGQFIERIEILKSHSRAEILISELAISFRLLRPGAPTSLGLQLLCAQLDQQLFSMGQLCNHFSPFLFRVKDLRLSSTRPSSGQDDVDGLEFIGAFSGAEDFRLTGELATGMLCALSLVDGEHTTIFPSLRNLCVPELSSTHGPLWEAAQSLINSRWLRSSYTVPVVLSSTMFPALCGDEDGSGQPRQYFCTLCSISFPERQSLDRHNGDWHMLRILCSHCSDFEWPLGYDDLFREHLKIKHPELTFTDARIPNLA